MQAVRTTLNSARLASIIDLPIALRNREVEIIVLPSQVTPAAEKPDDEKSSVGSIMGILKEYANPALRELEEGAWERAAVEKYLEKMSDDRSLCEYYFTLHFAGRQESRRTRRCQDVPRRVFDSIGSRCGNRVRPAQGLLPQP